MRGVQDLALLTDDQRLLAVPWVIGFHLEEKKWFGALVDDLRLIRWNKKAFNKLILPPDEKDLA